MYFTITRTSVWCNEKPCEEAFAREVPNWHERSLSEEDYNRRFAEREGGKWRDKGTEHECTETSIRRREGNKSVWVVEIDTLEQLVTFAKKYGWLVFKGNEIEIYDGYRE